jgi:hypothetical protein
MIVAPVVRKIAKWSMPAALLLFALDSLFAGDDPAAYVAGLLVIGWISCRSTERRE